MANLTTQCLKSQILKSMRSFHVSITHNDQTRVMKKVMGGSTKKKFKYCEAPVLPTPTSFSKGAYEGKKSVNTKRVTVLNKLFMRYITDLMATGECSSKFVGHGIQINRVQITPDFNYVNVFWIAHGTEKDDAIELILNKNTGTLRHELAQLKVVGVIPKIKFVKDKQYAQSVEVDRLLSRADFGEDYVPVDLSSKLKLQLELNTSLEPHLIQQIQELDNASEHQDYEESLPSMPTNVFGLNHTQIMERVQKSKKKSQALHRSQPDNDGHITQSVNENPLQFANTQEEREAFKQFLQKRQILKDKALRANKNYRPELEYMHEEWVKRQERLYNNYNFDDVDAYNDFIDEDVDNIK